MFSTKGEEGEVRGGLVNVAWAWIRMGSRHVASVFHKVLVARTGKERRGEEIGKMGKSEEEGRGFAFHSRMEMGVAGVGVRVIKKKVWRMSTDRRERYGDQLRYLLVVKKWHAIRKI